MLARNQGKKKKKKNNFPFPCSLFSSCFSAFVCVCLRKERKKEITDSSDSKCLDIWLSE